MMLSPEPEILEAPIHLPEAKFAEVNDWVSDQGREFVALNDLESFDPFFLSVVTVSNQWFFCSSHGSLSAGRESPETALFPYLTVDKIHENWNTTGPYTAIQCDGKLWHPFWPTTAHSSPVRRRLLKSILGEELVFEERHEALQLRFTYRWQVSEKFGFVRKVEISNEGEESRTVRLLDGLQDLQAPGVGSRLHLELSSLADAYKMSELVSDGNLMIHRLASGIVDAPIPLECLKATTVWTAGFEDGNRFLSRGDAERYLKSGRTNSGSERSRGERGVFLLGGEMTLLPGQSRDWLMVGEVEQTHRDIGGLMKALDDPKSLLAEVEEDLAKARERLRELAESVDGIQKSGDRDSALSHYHNTLCNFLRGGLPEKGGELSRDQLIHFVKQNSTEIFQAHGEWLLSLPKSFERLDLIGQVREKNDPDLLRLAEEYLPLILGRRHGDPSRPWNKFKIRLADDEGKPVHHYEGNWRDIFQNWEALAWSYPVFLDGFISRFLNASTIDGYNPYRVTSSGVDWEVPDKDDPWVSIGYWGDHQIVYLLKFLELKEKLDPGSMRQSLIERRYVFADVPYLLNGWEETLEDPRNTVDFDEERHKRLMERKESIGGDGLLLRDDAGELVRATLIEKLLIPTVAKLGQLIPDGGIWMSNQKPEWNDANNALAGTGLSVVTTAYLLRYFRFLERLVNPGSDDSFEISTALAQVMGELKQGLEDPRWHNSRITATDRFELAKVNGVAIEDYRKAITTPKGRELEIISQADLSDFITVVSRVLESVLRGNRREDGLWHSYNILEIRKDERVMNVQHLQLMLEGQVAILSSGLLGGEEAVSLLEALPSSELRSKRHPTYLLYPDRELPRFGEMNRIDDSQVQSISTLTLMIAEADERLVYQDEVGIWRFHDSLVNDYALTARLDEIGGVSDEERIQIAELYEKTFNHHSFTGRSGSMFGYEGLGCVYWHMVSKLMLAAQEVAVDVVKSESSEELKRRAIAVYYSIQRGLGFRQKPKQYGAFPAEPYSHSQGQRGAQQPGLTGQVKEGILCRMGELGIDLAGGRLGFQPKLLRKAEFAKGDLHFTHARTPIVYQLNDELAEPIAEVHTGDGRCLEFPGAVLDVETSSSVIFKEGGLRKIVVKVPAAWLIS